MTVRSALLGLALIFAGLAACNKKPEANFERPPAPVTVARAVARDVPVYIDAMGKIVAREVVSIQPQVSGRITQIHFTDGADVKVGELLFTIDPRPYQAQLNQAEANSLKPKAALSWPRSISRGWRSVTDPRAVSRQDYDAKKSAVETRRGDAQTKSRGGGERALESGLLHDSLADQWPRRATAVDVGNVVTANSGSLLVIQRLDPIYADFTVTESELERRAAQHGEQALKVEVRLPDDGTEPREGKLTFLDNSVQDGTGTVKLRATLTNDDRRFWPGRFAKIRLILGTQQDAVLIPAEAPQMSAKGSFVYVVKPDSTAELRPVKVGQRQGDLVVINKGIKSGERVVVTGQLGVTPGGKVRMPQPADQGRKLRAPANAGKVVNFSEPFIRRPVMTTVLTVSVILFGVLSYFRLPVNDLPAVDYPVIQVQAGYPGASPDTVANNIATPLERQFMQINGLELVTSKSTQGHTSLTLQFASDKSIDAAATDVQTAISQATGSLPVDLPSPPTFSKTNPNDQPIMYIALTSDSVTPGQLYDYASTQVGQRISILPGVSRVNVFGTKSAIRIKADPSAMWARGISIDDLAAAIKNGTSYTGAGQFDAGSGTALLRPQGQLESAAGYSNLIVGTHQRRAGLSARRRHGGRFGSGRADQHALLGARLSGARRHRRRRGQSPGRRQRRGSGQEHPRPAAADQRRAARIGSDHADL